MTDSTMKDLQHGSIIKTINNANKREEWSLVLGVHGGSRYSHLFEVSFR